MSFFISNAIATTSIQSQSSPYSLVVILVIFSLICYFMILRPQHKRTKKHKDLISSLAKGDEVMTTGGLLGRVVKVTDTSYISIALNDTNEVIINRDFVVAVLPKGTMNKFY